MTQQIDQMPKSLDALLKGFICVGLGGLLMTLLYVTRFFVISESWRLYIPAYILAAFIVWKGISHLRDYLEVTRGDLRVSRLAKITLILLVSLAPYISWSKSYPAEQFFACNMLALNMTFLILMLLLNLQAMIFLREMRDPPGARFAAGFSLLIFVVMVSLLSFLRNLLPGSYFFIGQRIFFFEEQSVLDMVLIGASIGTMLVYRRCESIVAEFLKTSFPLEALEDTRIGI